MTSRADCSEKIFQNLMRSLNRSSWKCYPDTTQSSPKVKINNDPKWLEEKYLSPLSIDRYQIKRSVDGWLEKAEENSIQIRLPYDIKLYSIRGVGLIDLHVEQYKRAHSNVLFFIYEKSSFPYPKDECKDTDCSKCKKIFYPFYIISLSEISYAPKAIGVGSLGETGMEYGPGRLFVEEGRARGDIKIYQQSEVIDEAGFIYESMTKSAWIPRGSLVDVINEFSNKCTWQKP